MRRNHGRACASEEWIAVMRLLVILFIGLSLTSPASSQSKPEQSPAKTIYILCDSLLDGKSDQLRKNVLVAIEGDKISRIGPAANTSCTDVIHFASHTCMPGVSDRHTHVLLWGDIIVADYDAQLMK